MELTANEQLVLLAGVACLLFALAAVVIFRMRVTPAERERRRRQSIHLHGRMGDGIVSDVQEETVYFSYSVSGVVYNTSQDISALRPQLPADLSLVVGPVTLKYLTRNPANSIVVSEQWSGIRVPSNAQPPAPRVTMDDPAAAATST